MITTIEHGEVRELRLSRPPVNALSPELLRALTDAVERAPKEGVRAVVISGAPGMFTAGLDVPLLLGFDRAGIAKLWGELYALMRALARSPVPVVAAMTGHAPAGGTVIAVFCDHRVMARGDFKLGMTEVQVGIPLPPVILRALQRQVGLRAAERLAVGGVVLSPDEALSAGLVDELAMPEEVATRAVVWCKNLAALPSAAMMRTRQLARADLAKLFESGSEQELEGVVDAWWSEETQSRLKEVVANLGKRAGGGARS